MGRSESKQVTQQQMQQSAQNQANAQTALGGENQAIGDFRKSITDFGNWNWNEFQPGGEFMKDATTLATSANSGGKNSFEDYMGGLATRTGSGTTPQMIVAAEENDREGRRKVQDRLLAADQQRIAALGHGLETVMGAEGSIPGMYGSQYSASLGGAGSAGANAANAARTPGFWDSFLPALAGGAATVGAGFTPHG